MADEPKKKEKKPSDSKTKAKSSSGPPSPGGGPPGMDPGAGGPPLGMPPVGGAAMGGDPSMGAPPPMPGEGIDPYAALMGQVSKSPMSMPMGGGPMGDIGGGGGLGGGMGMGAAGPQAAGPGLGPAMGVGMGGPPGMDPITMALMGEANPAAGQPDLGEHALDPQAVTGQQMSLQQLLQLLALAQGGIPSSGLAPPAPPGSTTFGMPPNAMAGVG